MASDHTPTPWQACFHLRSAENDKSCPCGYRGGIWGDNGNLLVCEMRNCRLSEGSDMIPVGTREEQLANAALIVEAVNSYEANKGRLSELEAENRRMRWALDYFKRIADERERTPAGELVVVSIESCRDARAALEAQS